MRVRHALLRSLLLTTLHVVEDSIPEEDTDDNLPDQIPTVVIPRFIDDHPPSPDLFLGNLPFSVNKPLVRQFFNRYGTIIDVRVGASRSLSSPLAFVNPHVVSRPRIRLPSACSLRRAWELRGLRPR